MGFNATYGRIEGLWCDAVSYGAVSVEAPGSVRAGRGKPGAVSSIRL